MVKSLVRKLACEILDQRLLLATDLVGSVSVDGEVMEVSGPLTGLESTDTVQVAPLPGDANQDGRFDQLDIIQVLTAERYLTGHAATWAEGDWNGDEVFDQKDLTEALQTGLYADGSFLARPGFGQLYHNGEVVRTVVPPASMPKPGTDNFYAIPGQFAVAAVAPGDRDYHGGKWAFHSVSWNVGAYELKSEAEVLAAEAAGDISITRVVENDFKCPIQP